MKWNEQLYSFYKTLTPLQNLPNNIEWLYPQKNAEVLKVVESFLDKYYNDSDERILMLGINPGRYGAGVTGVNFTAPKQLTEECKIAHPFKVSSELSAEFIYKMISNYGGPELFYSKFFISSVCPLGFVKGGKNINYYDDKALLAVVEPFIISTMDKLLQMNFSRAGCVCIGEGKNYNYICELNEKFKWFNEILALPHPRFIMQYKRKHVEHYIGQYVSVLKKL